MAATWNESDKEKMNPLVEFFNKGLRSPVFRRPDEVGLAYEDVFFPSQDGVPLEGWFIPAKSNKIIICNHFMPGNRYGYAGHLEGFQNFGGFEVNFLPQYKALHDAGYNILAYDLRNHGLSGQGNGGNVTIGLREYRDVIGSLQYVNSRADTKDMVKGLLSVCLGCDATIVAMDKNPEYFKDIKAMVALQPISLKYFIEKAAENQNLKVEEATKYFAESLRNVNGFILEELSPTPYAKSVTVPTKVLQVRNDYRTNVADVQEIYDTLLSKQKELYWIEGTDERFEGYNFLSRNPQHMIEWFEKYV